MVTWSPLDNVRYRERVGLGYYQVPFLVAEVTLYSTVEDQVGYYAL
jgi:hypothetical protein